MKGGGGGGVYSGKRRWRGLVIAVLGLVFLSMLVPLLFLLGPHNGFHSPGSEQQSSPSIGLGGYSTKIIIRDASKLSEGDRCILLSWVKPSLDNASNILTALLVRPSVRILWKTSCRSFGSSGSSMAGFLLKGSYGGGSFDLSISLVAVFVVVSSSSSSSEGREKLTLVLTLVLGSEELKNLTLLKVRKGDSDNGRSNLLWWFSVSEEEEEAKEMVLLEWLAAAMAMRRLLRTKGKGLDL
ncbi:uncharacterized protein LOC110769364 [Prunus avium]|uniref:Uncharacterized protein LOC110769364 n=1 Tax=Prunus avium TaxID=42229 RepID=A0A6P5TPM8_PRUAV|nr:uncharacterized protein LOC110769364 [Prunus avium]